MSIVVDAKDMIVGRIATYVAKQALLGQKVDVVNCKYAVISGSRVQIFEKFRHRRTRGTYAKGPFYSRQPDRLMRRMIRGMLPHQQPRGKEAFTRIMCYNEVPEVFKETKATVLENAHVRKLPNLKYVTMLDICKHLGGKIQ